MSSSKFICKSYILFLVAMFIETDILRHHLWKSIFWDSRLEWPPLLIATFGDGKMLENRFYGISILRWPPLLIDEFQIIFRGGHLRTYMSILWLLKLFIVAYVYWCRVWGNIWVYMLIMQKCNLDALKGLLRLLIIMAHW